MWFLYLWKTKLTLVIMSESALTVTKAPSIYPSPVVTRERFAEMCGLPVGVIVGWCNKGLVPCFSIGKYSLINLALLEKKCADREFV